MGEKLGLPAALLVLLLATPLLGQEGAVVKEIAFEGVENIDVSSLEFKLTTKVGGVLSDRKLAEDVSTLHDHFEEVRTRIVPVSGGVKVVFVLEEAPVLASVIFQGFDALEEEEARAETRTKQGFPFTEYRVQMDLRRLEELLREKGHYFAEVHATVKEYAGGKQVVFTAIEGPEVQIDTIRVVGNEAFDEDDFLREPWARSEESGLFGGGEFQMRSLQQDLVGIQAFYRYEGYLDAVVSLRPLEFSEDREEVTVTIAVTEGEPYLLEEVIIEGGESFPEDRGRLTSLVKLEQGQRVREEDLFDTRYAIHRFYLENAYYNAQ
ncbi:MAG: POTRA domain-containing protein, partial [Planctomycetota bacterium]